MIIQGSLQMSSEKILETSDFIDFIDSSLEEVIRQADLPIKLKNGNFRFQKYLVKKNHQTDHFDIIHLPTKNIIAHAFLKTTAFIVVNKHKRRQNFDGVIGHDKEFLKNYADCQFFKYTIKHSKEDVKRDSALHRFEICADKAMYYKEAIERELRAFMR